MIKSGEHILSELQKTLGEVESLVKSALESGGEQIGETGGRFQAALGRARERLADFETLLGRDLPREVQRGVRTADRYVHDNAWMAIGVAAAVGFLVGILSADRRS
jgi:ElaB/YqjD/DUF883 family membrane-anchored ribosome-binding protein